MSDQDAILRVQDLHKSYGKNLFKRGFPALQGVNLEIQRGSVFGLLGPNGAGKTTLIKVLLGLIPKYQGHAELFGIPVKKPYLRRRIGYLPEAHRLPPYLTGYQVMQLSGRLCGKPKAWLDERIPGLLKKVDMHKDAHKKLREYSKGMQQRVGLAQALLHEPELIFLDEPTDGIDPVGRAKIREIIANLKNTGTTIFINSHLLMEVEMICDQVVIMDKGKVLREGSMDELTQSAGGTTFYIQPVSEELGTLLEGIGSGFRLREGGFDLQVDQADQNRVIDLLRARDINILGIAKQKNTLEQSFIDLVGENAQ